MDLDSFKENDIIRCQVGVRDVARVPAFTEATDEDLFVYDVGVKVESVISPGWFVGSSSSKRGNDDIQNDKADGFTQDDPNAYKKARGTNQDAGGGGGLGQSSGKFKGQLDFGSLSLAAYEKQQKEKQLEVEQRLRAELLLKSAENDGMTTRMEKNLDGETNTSVEGTGGND